MRQRGHDDALDFALSIGLPVDYRRDPQAKKDVIDDAGDAHSVKSGQKKWQIFLYGRNRFQNDVSWSTMAEVGRTLLRCIDAFPVDFDSYQSDKMSAKEKLRPNMRNLAQLLRDKEILRAFLGKALFNSGEVNYLTIKEGPKFHVYWGPEILDVFTDNFSILNSSARSAGQVDEQKVIFKYNGLNVAELEMRNESAGHYREIRFNMNKKKAVALLQHKVGMSSPFNAKVTKHGVARQKFQG